MTDSPALILVPGAIMRRTRSPCSMFSPNSGSLNSITSSDSFFLTWLFLRCLDYVAPVFDSQRPAARIEWRSSDHCRLGIRGIRLLRVDAQVLNRFLHNLKTDFLFPRQSSQRSQHNMLGVHFEEVAQRDAVFTAAKTTGSQRY